jgi:hypothetical protein
MGKSVRELCQSMSAHELTVLWPVYFKVREDMREAEERKWEGRR